MSEDKAVKPWRCKHGHTLGVVARNSSGIRRLLLYRMAVRELQDGAPSGTPIDVMAIVEGYVADVRCSVCGCVRTWVPGEESLKRLLDHALGEDR